MKIVLITSVTKSPLCYTLAYDSIASMHMDAKFAIRSLL